MDWREEIMDGQHRANSIVEIIINELENLNSYTAREALKDELSVQLEKILKPL
jgi:hypothetical protein